MSCYTSLSQVKNVLESGTCSAPTLCADSLCHRVSLGVTWKPGNGYREPRPPLYKSIPHRGRRSHCSAQSVCPGEVAGLSLVLHTAVCGQADPSTPLQPSRDGGNCSLGDSALEFGDKAWILTWAPFLTRCVSFGKEFLCSSVLSPVKWGDQR